MNHTGPGPAQAWKSKIVAGLGPSLETQKHTAGRAGLLCAILLIPDLPNKAVNLN